DTFSHSIPFSGQALEPLASARGQTVVKPAAAAGLDAAASEQSLLFEPVQAWIDAAFTEAKLVPGLCLDFLNELIAVQLATAEELEDEQFRDAIEQFRVGFVHCGGDTLNYKVCQASNLEVSKTLKLFTSLSPRRFVLMRSNSPTVWRFAKRCWIEQQSSARGQWMCLQAGAPAGPALPDGQFDAPLKVLDKCPAVARHDDIHRNFVPAGFCVEALGGCADVSNRLSVDARDEHASLQLGFRGGAVTVHARDQ